MNNKRRWPTVGILLALSVSAQAGDHIFDANFSERAEGPHSDAQAARFLTQATFGPTPAAIAHLAEGVLLELVKLGLARPYDGGTKSDW